MERILAIDDEPGILFVFKAALSEAGYEVITKESSQSGLDFLNHNPNIDLILLDLHMPRLSGKDFLSLMRKDFRFTQTPVVIVTASLPGSEEFPPKESYQTLLEKPFDLTDLVRTVSEQIKISRYKLLSNAS